jgi:AAA domain-containing protein
MPSLDEAIGKEPVRALIYSPTGTGKTSLWGLMSKYEEFSPIYCLDFDLRIASLRAILSPAEMSRIKFDSFRDRAIQGEAYVAAEAISRNVKGLNSKYGVEFKTIVVDSGTFMATQIMNRVLMMDGGKPATSNPQLQHYLQLQSLQAELIGRLAFSGLNFIFTAHEDTSKDEITGRLFKAVDLNGKSANKIPGYFNEIWHPEIRMQPGGVPQYVVRTRSDAIYSARTSFRQLESVEPQEAIWKKILSSSEPYK